MHSTNTNTLIKGIGKKLLTKKHKISTIVR